MIELSLCPLGSLCWLLRPSTVQLWTYQGPAYCAWHGGVLVLPPASHSRIPQPALPTTSLNSPLMPPSIKESWKPNGRQERWLLVQIIHWSVLSCLDELWGYWLMHLGDKNYLINQTQIAYICLCGSFRISSTIFLADKNRDDANYMFGTVAKYLSKAGK